jgi:hypothetical protein
VYCASDELSDPEATLHIDGPSRPARSVKIEQCSRCGRPESPTCCHATSPDVVVNTFAVGEDAIDGGAAYYEEDVGEVTP